MSVMLGCLLVLVVIALVIAFDIALAYAAIWAHNVLATTQWPYDWQHLLAIIIVLIIVNCIVRATFSKE